MSFVKIKNRQPFDEVVENNQEFGFIDYSVGLTNFRTYIYRVMPEGIKNDSLKQEMRGLTFNLDNNKVASRPFHKFFNLGEISNPNLAKIISVQEKVDGSMIHPLLYNRESGEEFVIFKTKASPYSDVAKSAHEFIKSLAFYEEFIKFNTRLLKADYTPVYEYFTPQHQIVINYKRPFIKLLTIRHMITGEYIEFNSMEELKDKLPKFTGFDFLTEEFIPKRYNYTIEEIKKLQEVEKEIEGFVIVNDESERYKLKTVWYLDRHHVFGLSKKQIYKAIVEKSIDDIKAFAVSLDMLEVITRIDAMIVLYKKALFEFNEYVSNIRTKYNLNNITSRKEKAAVIKSLPDPTNYLERQASHILYLEGDPINRLIKQIESKPMKFWKFYFRDICLSVSDFEEKE